MAAYMHGQSVESRASSCVRMVSLRALVRVPLIDTLDNPLCHGPHTGKHTSSPPLAAQASTPPLRHASTRPWPPACASSPWRSHACSRAPSLHHVATTALARLLSIARPRPPLRTSSLLHGFGDGGEGHWWKRRRGMAPNLGEGEEDGLAAMPSSPWLVLWTSPPSCWCCHFSFFSFRK